MSNGLSSQRVIYPLSNGGVAIIVPSAECTDINQLVAQVPEGRSHQIVDVTEIPTDRTFRDAWTFSED